MDDGPAVCPQVHRLADSVHQGQSVLYSAGDAPHPHPQAPGERSPERSQRIEDHFQARWVTNDIYYYCSQLYIAVLWGAFVERKTAKNVGKTKLATTFCFTDCCCLIELAYDDDGCMGDCNHSTVATCCSALPLLCLVTGQVFRGTSIFRFALKLNGPVHSGIFVWSE